MGAGLYQSAFGNNKCNDSPPILIKNTHNDVDIHSMPLEILHLICGSYSTPHKFFFCLHMVQNDIKSYRPSYEKNYNHKSCEL